MSPSSDVGPPLGWGLGRTDPSDVLRQHLFERRIVSLTGPLDELQANSVATALMTLDATGDEAVELRVDSGQGTTGAALTVMDIVGLMGVPVRAVCVGQATGPALGVLGVCHHRSMLPHARLGLFEPGMEASGTALQLEQAVADHLGRWTSLLARLAESTGQPVDRLRQDAAQGRFLTAAEAVDYGLVDEIATAEGRLIPLREDRIGFRPR